MASIDAGIELRAGVRQVHLDVIVLGADRGQGGFEMQAGIERQRAGINLLAAQVGPFFDLVCIARLDRETDVEREHPHRLHRLALHARFETLEAAAIC